MRREVALVLEAERTAWLRNDQKRLRQLIDEQVEEQWIRAWVRQRDVDHNNGRTASLLDIDSSYQAQILDLRLDDQLAAVTMLIHHPVTNWWEISPSRERRFYRRSERGWVRTLPEAGYWGAYQEFETTHLLFRVPKHDAVAVQRIAASMDTLYQKLATLLELSISPQASTEEKIIFVFVPNRSTRWNESREWLEATTPSLREIPAPLSDEQYLAHYVTGRLISLSIDETFAAYSQFSRYRWEMVLWGLRGWLQLHLLEERAPWQQQAEKIFLRSPKSQQPLTFIDINSARDASPITRERLLWQYMAAESFIDYTVTHFGTDTLPLLIQSTIKYRSWAGLIQGVYGLTAEEFERGWNQHLKNHHLLELKS